MAKGEYMYIRHRRRKVLNIGGPRFRILGGGGGKEGANFSLAVNRSEPLSPISAI